MIVDVSTGALGALAFYGGLNAAILFWLAFQTGRVRQREKVSMGDGGNPRMIRIMRGHANALEFIPITLLTMAFSALLGAPAIALHVFGVLLTAGRVLHALHFTAADAPGWQRFAGTGLSMLAMLGSGMWALVAGVLAMV